MKRLYLPAKSMTVNFKGQIRGVNQRIQPKLLIIVADPTSPTHHMNEDFLGFVWRYQYFNTSQLSTQAGEAVQVLRTGTKNTDSGPDFSEAAVRIGSIEWIGSVELHVKSSDWEVHRHTSDKAYERVVLHVVWEDDSPVKRNDGTLLPTLALRTLVDPSVKARFDLLMNEKSEIPCATQFGSVPPLQKFAMLDRVLLERLDHKAQRVLALWEQNDRDWEETAYQWLGQYFGFRLNSPAFLRLTQQLSLKTLLRHRSSRLQMEALLFGMSGLIPDTSKDSYTNDLQREYRFLSTKYNLTGRQLGSHEWKFMRLRPAGFPPVRIAQFATLLQKETGLFALLSTTEDIATLRKHFRVQQSDYWKSHYRFGRESDAEVPGLGADAADLLVINAAIPLLVAFSQQRAQPTLLDRAIRWLEQLPVEKNKIIREWANLGMKVQTAFDSQALNEWHTHYCTHKRCLECTVGAALIRPN